MFCIALECDYFIAVGTNFNGHKGFPQRRFFWCTEQSYVFSEMPQPRMAAQPIFEQLQCMFQGSHTHIVVRKDGSCDMMRLDSGSHACTEGSDITELDRLAYTVCQIDSQCQIVPVGSYKKTPLNEIMPNEAFEGTQCDMVDNLKAYMYFRPV